MTLSRLLPVLAACALAGCGDPTPLALPEPPAPRPGAPPGPARAGSGDAPSQRSAADGAATSRRPFDTSGDTTAQGHADGAGAAAPDVVDGGRPPADVSAQPADSQPSVTGDAHTPDAATAPPPEPWPCTVHFHYAAPPGTSAVQVGSEANGWEPSAWPLSDANDDGIWEGEFDVSDLPAGPYGYKFVVNGDQWVLDPANSMRKVVGGIENSKFYVPDCTAPHIEVEQLHVDAAAGTLDAVLAVRAGAKSTALDPATATVRVGGVALTPVPYDAGSQRFVVHVDGLTEGEKATVQASIRDTSGHEGRLWAPVWVEAEPWAWTDAVLYFPMTDRFVDAAPNPPSTTCHPLTSWAGGDWAGITQRIEEGYFDELGVNALWLSPVRDNPEGCFPGDLDQLYSAYHGYFPQSLDALEEHFGTEDDLSDLVQTAHAHGIRVLADLVLNHVYKDHPLVGQHPEWFHPYCQCGGECDWDADAERCWFQPYLPDLDYRDADAVDAMVGAAVELARRFDLDGFRVDAAKHMYIDVLATLRHALDTATSGGTARFFLIGETFVGDWGGGEGAAETLMAKYIAPSLLDGQFDFPLYWRVLRAFARDESPFVAPADYLVASAGYWGPAAVMGSFLGNHDVPRFISHANGDIADVWGNGAREQAFSNPPPQPAAHAPYQRLTMAWAFLFCSPGIPLVYYGDEIGLAGAGDPDDRRPMPWGTWSEEQEAVRQAVAALGQARRAHSALRRGSFALVEGQTAFDRFAVVRKAPGDAAVCLFNRGAAPHEFAVALPATGLSAAQAPVWVDVLDDTQVNAQGDELSVEVGARAARVLVPAPNP